MMSILRTRTQSGATLIEILISLLMIAFGLLGIAGFITKSTTLTSETTQRARASALLSDMAARISSNKPIAAGYVAAASANPDLGKAVESCVGKVAAALDVCQWSNLLAGVNDAGSTGNSAALGFRGCITKPTADANYVVAVAWGAMSQSFPPADSFGAGSFGDDTYRRVLRAQVRIPNLGSSP